MSVFDKFSGIGVASGFKLQAKAPLDARQVVDSIEDRNALITENGAYEGMQVYVKADKKTYLLKDLTAGTWEELGSGGGGGTSVQADYNQNDSTAADYIKNRPFYEETKTAFAEVFNETLAFDWDETGNVGGYGNEYSGSNPMGGITGGEPMTVIFNGVEYSGTTQDLPDDMKEEIEEIGGAGFVFGAPFAKRNWQPTAEFPFTVLYYGVDNYEGQTIGALTIGTSINQASIPVIIKASKTTTEIHTINPKYIKDMYYEETSETEVYSGTLTTTASGSVFKGTLPLSFGWFPLGIMAAKITIDGVTFSLPVTQDSSSQLCLIGGLDISDYGLRILTIGSNTTIETNKQYDDVALSISSYDNYINKIPTKYLSLSGLEITLSPSDTTNTAIAEALKTYLNANAEALETLKSSMSFQLNLSNGDSYTYQRNYMNTVAVELRFLCLFINPENAFDAYKYTEGYVLIIKISEGTASTVTITNISMLSTLPAYQFKVADTDVNTDNNAGLLGIFHFNTDTSNYFDFNGAVALHDWITKAQQRIDFQIPPPTKPTDLVDKQYADSLASGGSSLSIELAVGASENTADVFKTYLNNNASVLTQLKAASSFNLKVVKTTSVTTITETYIFAKNYTNTFTGVQYHFVCVYGSGQTSTAGTVLWFSVSDDTVSDLKLTSYTFTSPTYNHNISITDGSTYALRFTYPSKSTTLITTQAQLATLIGSEELAASGWALVDTVYYAIGFVKNNSYCYFGNTKEPTWHGLGSYTITDELIQ